MRPAAHTLLALALALLLALGGAAAQPPATKVFLPAVARPHGPANSLALSAATHLGGPQEDAGAAVAIAADGTIVFGGTLPGYQPPITPTLLLGGGAGAVLRFDAGGRRLLSATRVGGDVADLELGPDGAIAVCGDFGVALLDPAAARALWSAGPGAARRCAAGSDGTVAALVGGEVAAYGAGGAPLGRWPVGGSGQSDLAVDGRSRLVIVTGYTQVSGTLQIPFIRAYGYDGALRWRSYDFPAGTPNLGTADSRGERVAIGRDGKLYLAGSINGGTGASVFARDPQDAARSAADRTVVTDKYTNPSNVGSVRMLWFGRFNPADGALELAQSVLTRRGDDRGNSIGAAAIAADADGTVYLAGAAAAFIAGRAEARVAGVAPGAYSGGDPYALVVSPDFRERRIWVPFTGPGGRGGAEAIAARDGAVALAATLAGGSLITHQALQPAPGGASDAYLAAWE